MAVHVHGHEGGQLHEARIDQTARALEPAGHDRDQVLLEPVDRLCGCEIVDLGGVQPAVDRAGHQRQAGGRRRIVVLGHDRGSRERLYAGLADGDDVHGRAEMLEKFDEMADIAVHAERAG